MSIFTFPVVEGWSLRAVSAQNETLHQPSMGTGFPGRLVQGPYIIWWNQNLRNNPVYEEWAEKERAHWKEYNRPTGERAPGAYLPNGQMIVRYTGPEDKQGAILWQGGEQGAKYEAQKVWASLKDEYPYWYAHGGARSGAGHPTRLGESKLVSIDMPLSLIADLDAEAKAQGVSRNELIRQRLG